MLYAQRPHGLRFQEFRPARHCGGGARRRAFPSARLLALRRFRGGHRRSQSPGRQGAPQREHAHHRRYGRRSPCPEGTAHRRVGPAHPPYDSPARSPEPGASRGDRRKDPARAPAQGGCRHYGRLRGYAARRKSPHPGGGAPLPRPGRHLGQGRLAAHLGPADGPAPLRQTLHTLRERTQEHPLHVHYHRRTAPFRGEHQGRDGRERRPGGAPGLVCLHRNQLQDPGRAALPIRRVRD